MTMPAIVPTLTPEAYLDMDRKAELKSEYLDGEVVAMSGASLAHNLIAWNIGLSVRNQLGERPCTVLGMDMRVRVDRSAYTYPDLAVVCGEIEVEDDQGDTLLNPTVIVEVLSPSTEGYDRGEKFRRYRRIPGLRHYVLVAQDAAWVEVFTRQGDMWVYADAEELDASIALDAIGCTLALGNVYAKVPLTASPTRSPTAQA